MQSKQHDVRLSVKNLESHPFLMSQNYEVERVTNGTESNGLNLFSRIRGIVNHVLGNSLLPQVVLISSIKQSSSSISFSTNNNKQRLTKTNLSPVASLTISKPRLFRSRFRREGSEEKIPALV